MQGRRCVSLCRAPCPRSESKQSSAALYVRHNNLAADYELLERALREHVLPQWRAAPEVQALRAEARAALQGVNGSQLVLQWLRLIAGRHAAFQGLLDFSDADPWINACMCALAVLWPSLLSSTEGAQGLTKVDRLLAALTGPSLCLVWPVCVMYEHGALPEARASGWGRAWGWAGRQRDRAELGRNR